MGRTNIPVCHEIKGIIMSPTIVFTRGWRLFFYSNENDEPMHIHAKKGNAECKFWLHSDMFEIEEAYNYNLTPVLRREIRQIIYFHFSDIVEAWEKQWKQ